MCENKVFGRRERCIPFNEKLRQEGWSPGNEFAIVRRARALFFESLSPSLQPKRDARTCARARTHAYTRRA